MAGAIEAVLAMSTRYANWAKLFDTISKVFLLRSGMARMRSS